MAKLLLFSNSKNHGQDYLDHARAPISDFLGDGVETVTFAPYAGVTVALDDYTAKVRSVFAEIGYDVVSLHETSDPAAAIRKAEAIAVGGGNTPHLLYRLYEIDAVDVMRERALAGVPYMGWSAGSVVACPTIGTTNDMPIVHPPSLDALDLVPFQINPHFLDTHPEGHQGETREDRLNEFIEVNRDVFVVGLREGSALLIDGTTLRLLGPYAARVFHYGESPRECDPPAGLQFLME